MRSRGFSRRSGRWDWKGDVKWVVIIFVVLMVVPLLTIPGFPFVFIDQEHGILWRKSIVMIVYQNWQPVLMALVLSVLFVTGWKLTRVKY